MKDVMKEIIITALCAVVIVLVLGIIFYESVASNKIIPVETSYEIPEDIQAELDEIAEIKSLEKTNIVYTIDGSDLSLYKQTQSYNPGKVDPFAEYEEETPQDTNAEKVQEVKEQGYNNVKQVTDNQTSEKNTEGTLYENKSTK
ncbi:MAG: hypothetical protein Q4G05_00515 [Clostridia bacterium]|nr:hypothetical protein [Clostridia bacterium]